MTGPEVPPSELRDRLETLGTDLKSGDAAGYTTLDTALNLNALAIGLGLANIEYEPEQFPGLIYHVEQPQATVVLFENGVITTIDARNEQAVKDAVSVTVERAIELGLLERNSTPAVETTTESVPISDDADIEGA